MNKAFEIALSLYGEKEIKGNKHNPVIVNWFKELGHGWVNDDETAYCAAFMGYCLEKAGIESTKKLNARSYLEWGTPTKTPSIGDVVVFWRGNKDGWQGHVGFFVRATGDDIYVLGGNQSDMVNIQAYPKSRLLGYRTVKENLPVGKESLHTQVVRESLTTESAKIKALINAIKYLMGKR